MKLVLAIISNDDSSSVSKALSKNSFQVTKLATTGGFLSKGNTTLLIGCDDKQVNKVIELIGSESKKRTEIMPSLTPYDTKDFSGIPVEITVGGATIFVLDIEKFVKL